MKETNRNSYSLNRNDTGGGGPSFQNLKPKDEKPNIYTTLLAMQENFKNEFSKSGVDIKRSFLSPQNGTKKQIVGNSGSGHFSNLEIIDDTAS